MTSHSNKKNIGLQPREKTAMLVDKTILFFSQNLPEQGVYIPVYFLNNLRRYSYESGHHPRS